MNAEQPDAPGPGLAGAGAASVADALGGQPDWELDF